MHLSVRERESGMPPPGLLQLVLLQLPLVPAPLPLCLQEDVVQQPPLLDLPLQRTCSASPVRKELSYVTPIWRFEDLWERYDRVVEVVGRRSEGWVVDAMVPGVVSMARPGGILTRVTWEGQQFTYWRSGGDHHAVTVDRWTWEHGALVPHLTLASSLPSLPSLPQQVDIIKKNYSKVFASNEVGKIVLNAWKGFKKITG